VPRTEVVFLDAETQVAEAAAIIERHKGKFDQARELFILEKRRAERAVKDVPPVVAPVGRE